jgi:hypothetical protein
MPRLRFWKWVPANTKVNQRNHDWSQNGPVPENPMPGEVFDEEGFPRLRHVRCEDDVRRIHRNPEQYKAYRKASEHEG